MAKHTFSIGRLLAAGMAGAVGAYAATAAVAWLSYGRGRPDVPDPDADELLERFIPEYDVRERHHVYVHAPAEAVLAAARRADPADSPLVRMIFRARAAIIGDTPEPEVRRPLVEDVVARGWRVLAETPGREMVFGAATRPWEKDLVFSGIDPDAFAAFAEPNYVKIAWTLRADPDGPDAAVFRTETRVATTDAAARRRFRRYWAAFSPGIVLIRWSLLAGVKRDAEAAQGAWGAAAARV